MKVFGIDISSSNIYAWNEVWNILKDKFHALCLASSSDPLNVEIDTHTWFGNFRGDSWSLYNSRRASYGASPHSRGQICLWSGALAFEYPQTICEVDGQYSDKDSELAISAEALFRGGTYLNLSPDNDAQLEHAYPWQPIVYKFNSLIFPRLAFNKDNKFIGVNYPDSEKLYIPRNEFSKRLRAAVSDGGGIDVSKILIRDHFGGKEFRAVGADGSYADVRINNPGLCCLDVQTNRQRFSEREGGVLRFSIAQLEKGTDADKVAEEILKMMRPIFSTILTTLLNEALHFCMAFIDAIK